MFAVVIMLGGFLVVGLAIGLLLTFLYNAVWPEVTASSECHNGVHQAAPLFA